MNVQCMSWCLSSRHVPASGGGGGSVRWRGGRGLVGRGVGKGMGSRVGGGVLQCPRNRFNVSHVHLDCEYLRNWMKSSRLQVVNPAHNHTNRLHNF